MHPGAYIDPVDGVEVGEDQARTNIPTTVIPNQSSSDPSSSSTSSIYSDLKLFIRRRKREVNLQRAITAMVGYVSVIEMWCPPSDEEEH